MRFRCRIVNKWQIFCLFDNISEYWTKIWHRFTRLTQRAYSKRQSDLGWVIDVNLWNWVNVTQHMISYIYADMRYNIYKYSSKRNEMDLFHIRENDKNKELGKCSICLIDLMNESEMITKQFSVSKRAEN